MESTSTLSLESLPNEVLIQILSLFPTQSLLPLAAVCRRFHAVVSRIHHAQLVRTAQIQDHEMILECYHPSVKISTPYLFCDYLGTDGLVEAGHDAHLTELNGLYSRFRPVVGEEQTRPRSRYPTRQVRERNSEAEKIEEPELASHDVYLDSDEVFSQLCTVTNLVKVGQRPGLFLSHVNITDGVIRVWRNWLAEQKALTAKAKEQQATRPGLDDSSILWADPSKNVGLRFKVVEKTDMHTPILVGPGEERPVSYRLEYEELLIRTNQLLLSLEKSKAQEVNPADSVVFMASKTGYQEFQNGVFWKQPSTDREFLLPLPFAALPPLIHTGRL